MVGIPKSNRCTFCKLRKTKCDENWPTCGACTRAGKVCSGARNNYKFVVNGCHNEEPTPKSSDSDDASISSGDGSQARDPLSRRSSPGGTIMIDMKEYTATRGPGTFHRMRLTRPHRPRSVKYSGPTPSPTPSPVMSASDRLASQFVSCIEAASGTGHDLLIWGPSIKIIPQRLGSESPVLRHTVELVVASWSNSQRDVQSPETWLDLQLHMQALGSLRKALAEPSQGSVTDTITAQWLLQKLELTYDFERGANQENHAAGLTAVISRGGPWQGFQDLGLYATFDSFFNMLQEDVRQGRDSVFMDYQWTTALKQAVDNSMLRPVIKSLYRLWIEMTVWPTLVRMVRMLDQNPSDAMTMTALELLLRATPVIEYLENECEATLASLMETGDITEVENFLDADLIPRCYKFRDIDTAKFFYTHAMYSIIIYRTIQEANLVLNNYVPSVMKKCREYSTRIWMAYPWMRTQRPLAIEYTAALAFSYESANEEEREFCIRSLDDMEYFRRPPPIGKWIDATIMANVKGYTGRMPFIKDQDITIELCGLGCRC